jgi:hypothetical protein
MPSIRSARFTKAIPPHDHVRNPIPNPASRGSPRPPPWSVDHLNSPHTPSKPHTSTALAAYCKSPYRHRSAPTDRQTHTLLPAERCRYGTRDLATIEHDWSSRLNGRHRKNAHGRINDAIPEKSRYPQRGSTDRLPSPHRGGVKW